jgi:hypothetical protein
MATWLATGIAVRGERLATLPMWCAREHNSWFDLARRRKVLLILNVPVTLRRKTFLVCRQCREPYEISEEDTVAAVQALAAQPQPTALHDAVLPDARHFGIERYPDAVLMTRPPQWGSEDSLFGR